ncbi:MAG: hypothetical protein Q8N49_01005 [Candidatus Omnitrophota bacterium]|nr:hypothetical protein [Candidatus Omnitrophota bacterium]
MTQAEFFAYVVDVLEKLEVNYMITGSVASMAYGEPRLTLDMDIVIDLSGELAEKFYHKFPSPDYYADLDSMLAAIKEADYFNIIHIPSGSKVDFYQIKKDIFSQDAFNRRHKEAFDEIRLASFSSPEDVIINKLLFYKEGKSEKHIRDIKSILQISGHKLDMPYLDKKTRELGIYEYWQELKNLRP